MKSNEAVKALAALAHENRLSLFRLLVRRGPEGYNPGELAERLEMPAPTLSFHLKSLMHARLVASRREGRYLFYSANFDHMNTLIGFLTENCCSLGSECAPTCAQARQPTRQRSA